MLKLFREIRRKLIGERNIKKYLIYAIGEICLILIGLLLALQINKSQVQRNNQKEEIQFLRSVKQDLLQDSKSLNGVSKFKKNQVEACKVLIEYFKFVDKPVKDTLSFISKFNSTIYFILDNPNSTSFETAKASGSFHKYRNKELLNLLSMYYTDNEMKQHITDTKRFTNSYFEQHISGKYIIGLGKSIHLSNEGPSNLLDTYQDDPREVDWLEDFRKDSLMENYFIAMLVRLQIGINYIEKRDLRAKSLVQSIDDYLASL